MRGLPIATLLLANALGSLAAPITPDDELDTSPVANVELGKRDQVPLPHIHNTERPDQQSSGDERSTDEPAPGLSQTQMAGEIVETIATVEQDPAGSLENDLTELEYLQLMVNRLQREISVKRKHHETDDDIEGPLAESDREDYQSSPDHDNTENRTEGNDTVPGHQGPPSEPELLATTSRRAEPGFLESVKTALNYPLLEVTITTGGVILTILVSMIFIEIFYRIRAACSRRSRIRRMLARGETSRRAIEEAERFFEQASHHRRQQSQRGRSRGWLADCMGRSFSRRNSFRSEYGFNGNYGNEAGLSAGDKTPPPAYEDYAAHVSDGYCGGQYMHTTWPGAEAGVADEKTQQQQQDGVEYGEEDTQEYDEKAAMVEEEEVQEEQEQEQEAEDEGEEEREERKQDDAEEEVEEGEEDSMSMSQEIASFRSVADMVSELVAAAAAATERR